MEIAFIVGVCLMVLFFGLMASILSRRALRAIEKHEKHYELKIKEMEAEIKMLTEKNEELEKSLKKKR